MCTACQQTDSKTEMQPASRADGSGSTQAQGGMSRAEASRTRLAAQRERIAQQRARLSAGGARAGGIQRSDSGASVQSTLSSILDQAPQQERGPHVPGLPVSPRPVAVVSSQPHNRSPEATRRQALEPLPRPAPAVPSERLSGSSEDDRRPGGLQGRGSGASDGSRGSGLPSPGGPRSRSAAIDVPTSPNRIRRSPRYTPYEDDPYLSKMGAPPVADPGAAHVYTGAMLPGQGKAAREQPELSPVPEAINTGFASIDSKQKASQLFSIPARLTQDADERAQAADQPTAEPPRRKKKEEGSLPPRLKPPAGKQQRPGQPATESSLSPRPEALPQASVPLSPHPDPPSGTPQQVLPPGSAQAPAKDPKAPQQTTESFSQRPGNQSVSSMPAADAAAAPAPVAAVAPSPPAQTTPEAPPVKPYFPAFGSLIPPAPEDSFWQSAPAVGSGDGKGRVETLEAGQDLQQHNEATDAFFAAPAGDAADTDFWASAGQHAETAMQQPELSSVHLEEQEGQIKEMQNDERQQPLQQSALPVSHTISKPGGNSILSHLADVANMTDASFQGSSTLTHHQPGPLPGSSTMHAPSSGQHVESEPASSSNPVVSSGEDSTAPPQGAQEQQASVFTQTSNPFGLADDSYSSPLNQYTGAFPSGQDEDSSFFEGLGAPGQAEPVIEPLQAPSQEGVDASAPAPDLATESHAWHGKAQHILQGQQGAEQMQNQDYSTEGQPLHPHWDMKQHTLSSGEQQATKKAPLQQGDPIGQHQGHPGGYGQAAFNQGPFATAAAPEHTWEPQPAGVLDASALPDEAPRQAPRQDSYASGGQNYYGAGWQAGAPAGAPEASNPAGKSSSGWGKLGFWGGGQPAEQPAQPAPDEGVLYYGASVAHAAPSPLASRYPSQQPAQHLYSGFQPATSMPAAQPQQGAMPFGPPPVQTSPGGPNATPFTMAGVQPPPPAYARPVSTDSHAAQPTHMLSEPAQHSGGSSAPLAARQQAPWQPSAQNASRQQQAPQQTPPWLQSRPGGSGQSSSAQPQLAGNEPPWQSSGPLDSAVQHGQEAAGIVAWQASSASSFPLANGSQHADAAHGSAVDSAWHPGGDASMRDITQAEPQQSSHLDDQMQAVPYALTPAQGPDGQGAQAEQSSGTVVNPGPFGAADASDTDFWGHDAEVLLEGPFAGTTTQQGAVERMDQPEQEEASLAAAWGGGRPAQEQDDPGGPAHSTAEAAHRPDFLPSTEALQDRPAAPPQQPAAFEDAPALPAMEAHALQQGAAPDGAAGQPGTAQPDTASSATPFGSEAAQTWQTAGSAALPLPDELPASTERAHPAGAQGPQAGVVSRHLAAADSSVAPEEYQLYHGLPEHQASSQPQVVQEHQAWLQPGTSHELDGQAGSVYASYGTSGSGAAAAAQHGSDWHAGQYGAVSQHTVPTWPDHQLSEAFEHSGNAPIYQDLSMPWQRSQAAGDGFQDNSYAAQQSAAQHSIQQQTGQPYMPPTMATSGPLFAGGQNAWTAQQRRVPTDADAGLVPGSAAEGMRVTHGRPPCAMVAFGIGGRVAVLKPVLAHGHGSKPVYAAMVDLDSRWMPGRLSITRMGSLAAYLGSSVGTGQAGAVDDTDFLMQRFPGPLTPAVPREKVLAFLEERAAACEQSQSSAASVNKALWGVLRILAGNAGSLRPSARMGKGKPDEPLEAELAAVLAPAASGSPSIAPAWQAHGSSMAPFQGNGNGHAAPHPGAADALQKLLLAGKKAEALRTAVECGLWGPALILARAAGDAAYAETAAAMAAAMAGPGSPLSSLLLMLAGGHDLVLPAKPSARGSPAKAPSGSSFNLKGLLNKSASKADVADADPLDIPEPSAAELALLADWRSNLAALASCVATPADEALIVRLGDRLWEQPGRAEAAHLCYLVGGVLPQAYEASARMCLLGADHRSAPHTLASLPALQRTEVLEWAKLPGMAQPAQLALPLLPYKLLYAFKLAEYGHLAQALQYLGLVRASLGSLGNKMPAALLVCNGVAAELEQRLRAHAAAFNMSVKASQSSSLFGGLGRLLDKGINRLISGDLPPSGPPSTGSDADPLGRQLGRPADSGSPTHRRSGSMQHNGGVTPVASFKDLASASQQAFAQGGAPAHPSNPAGSPSHQAAGRQAPAAQPGPVAAGADPAASGPPSSGPSSIRSMLSGLGGLLGASLVPPKKEAKLGAEENAFFYDEERKMWRERGAEIPAAAAPLPPPPTARPPSTPGPSAGPPPPAGQARPASTQQQEPRGASSRYVNTLTSSSTTRTASAMLPPLVPPALGAAAKPPGSFFVPQPAAQRPAPISSPAQELASQPFDTGAPAQMLAEEYPVKEQPQAALQSTFQAQETNVEQPVGQFRHGEGRRSSGFGQWLNNGVKGAESQAGAPPPAASVGPAAPPGMWQGSQLYGQAAQLQPLSFQPPQPTAQHESASGDIFTAYASLVEPAQRTPAPSPGQGIGAQELGPTSVLGPSFPTRAGTTAVDNEEMREIEL